MQGTFKARTVIRVEHADFRHDVLQIFVRYLVFIESFFTVVVTGRWNAAQVHDYFDEVIFLTDLLKRVDQIPWQDRFELFEIVCYAIFHSLPHNRQLECTLPPVRARPSPHPAHTRAGQYRVPPEPLSV